MAKILVPLLLLAALGAGAAENVYLFDCGSDGSPLAPGFARLTPSGGKGAEWRVAGDLAARENPVAARKDGEDENLPPVFLDALTCDHLTGSGPAELRLSVPPGRYRIWVASGHPVGHAAQVWNTVVSAGRERRESVVFGQYGMRSVELAADADGEGLTLRLSTGSRWLLTALAVAPENEYRKVFDETVRPRWERITTFPPELDKRWEKTPPPQKPHAPPAPWSAERLDAGYVLFSRPWCEPVWPEELPRASELDRPVGMFAAPAEFETAGFTVHALRDFREVTLTVGNLAAENGDRLPPLEAHYIRFAPLRSYFNVVGPYFEGPDAAMPWVAQALGKGRNLRIWLTARVPEDAAPGDYRGTVTLGLDGAERKVPVCVKVLPIRLEKNPDYSFGMFYRPAANFFSSAPDAYSLEWWRGRYDAELADMRDCGMNMLMNGIGPRAEYSQRVLDKLADFGLVRAAPVVLPAKALYRKHMGRSFAPHMRDVQMPPDAFFDDIADYVKQVRKAAEGRDWPELLFFIADEAYGTGHVVDVLLRLAATVKEAGGNTFITADLSDPRFEPLLPLIDVWCSPDFALPPDKLAELRRRHPRLRCWAYPNNVTGSNNHCVPEGARMTYGFALWKSGHTGLMPWIYQRQEGDPWNNLDGPTADIMNKTGSDGRPIAVPHWIAFREGIDDGRYLHTLEKTVEAAREKGHSAEADQARELLRTIGDAIPVQRRYRVDGVWDGGAMDACRWRVAEEIMRLGRLPGMGPRAAGKGGR